MIDQLAKDTMEVKLPDGKSSISVIDLFQTSFTGDAKLTTDYERDYITRGHAFEVQRRIVLTSQQTLLIEFNISLATNKIIYSLPVKAQTNGGNVFLDTFNADSSTGGTVLMVPNNLNANSSRAAMTTVKTGVTVSGTQTGVREYSIGTKLTNQSSGGGLAGTGFAKILNNTNPFYFKFVNQESASVTIDLGFVWYELEIAE